METIRLQGVDIRLAHADEPAGDWVGGEDLLEQLLAAWLVLEPADLPMSPRLIGRPGVGKTTLACAAAKRLGRPLYIVQATMDMRPEDLIITPVVGPEQQILYVASGLVTAMIKGGVCVLDEANRMPERSWAGLAPLLDNRRYVESIVAGVKVRAHPEFRFVATMNRDAGAFELPEYIQSRLQPQIEVPFPGRDEERRILAVNLPFSPQQMLDYTADFLARAHAADEPHTVRDGISILRYALKLREARRAAGKAPVDGTSSGIGGSNGTGEGAAPSSADVPRSDPDAPHHETVAPASAIDGNAEVRVGREPPTDADDGSVARAERILLRQAVRQIVGEDGIRHLSGMPVGKGPAPVPRRPRKNRRGGLMEE